MRAATPLIFAGALGWYVWDQRQQLEPLWDASILDLAAISALIAGAHFINSTEFWILYRAHSIRSGVIENWLLFFSGNLANYLPGQPGALYRLQYMRTVHAAPISLSAAVYGANLVATLAGAAVAGLIGVTLLGATDRWAWGMLLVYVCLGLVAIAAVRLPLPALSTGTGKLARAWRSFRSGFDQIRQDPVAAVGVAGLEVVKYGVTAVRFKLSFGLLGIDEGFWFFLALAPAAGLAQFFSFTPGALGFREGALSGAAVALGSPLSTGLLAATVDRAVMLATSIVLGAAGFAVTYPRLRRERARRVASTSRT